MFISVYSLSRDEWAVYRLPLFSGGSFARMTGYHATKAAALAAAVN
jgi:hypothetical protein